MSAEHYWTNSSVKALTDSLDPVEAISQKAREVILAFIESGGQGPPFNPFEIAAFLGIGISPSENVRDARTFYKNGKFLIEFNPNRPRSRVNYSISHEIAHTFFPNCKDEVRTRSTHEEIKGDDWQLEMLCNIGASEMLMPIGSFPTLEEEKLSIENLMAVRKQFNVSTESLLLRFIKLTNHQCSIFAASRPDEEKSTYKIDYSISSSDFPGKIPNGMVLPSETVVSECTAIGYTAKAKEKWPNLEDMVIECVGIPAYPGKTYPRVVGFIRPIKHGVHNVKKYTLLQRDATDPRGKGKKIVAFVVNDATPRWGAGFARVVAKKWPEVQKDFIGWVEESRGRLRLGNVRLFELDEDISIATLVSQHGYGNSPRPRIRYNALQICLQTLAEIAQRYEASIHLPKIGSGQAGGNWSIISEMIDTELVSKGHQVTVYQLESEKQSKNSQQSLLFSRQSNK